MHPGKDGDVDFPYDSTVGRRGLAEEGGLEDSTITRTAIETTLDAKAGAGDSAIDSTSNLRTDSKDCIVDSIDNCKLRIDRTDRELGFSDNILDTLDNISDFTGPTVESTGRTDCTKPTDVRKRYMSNREGLQQYTTSLQLSALLAKQPTSDSQEMP